jgi:hypothetical protein
VFNRKGTGDCNFVQCCTVQRNSSQSLGKNMKLWSFLWVKKESCLTQRVLLAQTKCLCLQAACCVWLQPPPVLWTKSALFAVWYPVWVWVAACKGIRQDYHPRSLRKMIFKGQQPIILKPVGSEFLTAATLNSTDYLHEHTACCLALSWTPNMMVISLRNVGLLSFDYSAHYCRRKN